MVPLPSTLGSGDHHLFTRLSEELMSCVIVSSAGRRGGRVGGPESFQAIRTHLITTLGRSLSPGRTEEDS